MTDNKKNLHEKIVSVQSQLKAPKGQYNKFGNYNYRSLEDVNEAVKPLLFVEGLKLTMSDDIVMIGDRFYVKASATISDGEASEVVCGFAREASSKKGMDESQITGTASSYARKYALNGLFLIDDTKDADSNENRNERDARQKKQQSNDQQTNNKPIGLSDVQKKTMTEKLTNFANTQQMTLTEATSKLFPYLKIKSTLPNLTPDEFGILMNYLNQHQ